MINSLRRETRSASREDRAGFAGWSHFYPANLADIVDPVFLYENISRQEVYHELSLLKRYIYLMGD